VGPFVIRASGQPGEAFFLQDQRDGDRASLLPLLFQGPADVINGEVLLAQGDDRFPHPVLARTRAGRSARGEEEFQLGVLPQLVTEDAETTGGVAEPLGRLDGREALDEKSPQRLVLAVEGVMGYQKDLSEAVRR
jgi:hypothetical protein